MKNKINNGIIETIIEFLKIKLFLTDHEDQRATESTVRKNSSLKAT
jgi:hypothetical protein